MLLEGLAASEDGETSAERAQYRTGSLPMRGCAPDVEGRSTSSRDMNFYYNYPALTITQQNLDIRQQAVNKT
jgi:hypothetical protein